MSSGHFRSWASSSSEDHSSRQGAVGSYWFRSGNREIRLEEGETLLGRDDACHIVVTGPLVSRRHAVVTVQGANISIEDLDSANGTFVNRARIHGCTPLQAGDRVTIGANELEIARYGHSFAAPAEAGDSPDRKTPVSGIGVGKFNATQVPPEASDEDTLECAITSIDVAALDSSARLAERMFALGRADAGRKILSEPLEEILATARSGKTPDPELIDAVGRHAVRLAHEVLEDKWVDLAIEVHWLSARPLRKLTLKQLLALRVKAPVGDDALIARYYERLRSRLEFMNAEERLLCEDVAALVPRLDENG